MDVIIFHFGLFLALQNFVKIKKIMEISSFYTCTPEIMIRICVVPEIWCTMETQAGGQMDGKGDI